MTADLAELIRDRVDQIPVPPGDLTAVQRTARGIRRRRRVPAVVAAAVLIGAAGYALRPGGESGRADRVLDPLGRLDFSDGLRAYAVPGQEVHLGGRSFPSAGLGALDTDAAATPFGIVLYVSGRPALLAESGDTTLLEGDAEKGSFLPTAKADSVNPWVAYGATLDGHPTVIVRDLETNEVIGRQAVSEATVIDALDDGTVFLRTDDGTTTWDPTTGKVAELAGRRTSVADVRNGVLLYDGKTPGGPASTAYRLVRGPIDAQLTFDGGHILSWSSRLESTDGSAPIVLDHQADFFAVDTDGSILAAAMTGDGATVYDCEVPSGTCTELGPLTALHGDPEFIGVDM
ncbi:MAG: hypothetical protein QM714_10430 [Nocardioides sp.]|uniref:hypothetical protein n=1 Tax=Nocardioides sp. TaxID=35761 RepID=UPI0039E2C5E4